jgi:hypothetical protein
MLERYPINPPPVPKKFIASLLGLLVPKVLEGAISGIAGALKKAGEKDTQQIVASEVVDLYVADAEQALSPNPMLGCVLGVWFTDRTKGSPADDDVVRTLKGAGLVPDRAAVLGVFEAAIRPSDDRSAFFLETRHFSVRDFLGQRSKDERAFVVTLGIATADATGDGATFALGTIDFGTRTRDAAGVVPPGQPLGTYPRFRSNLMPWSPISAASKAAYERDVAADRAAGHRYMPVTFSLTVSETADGNAFLLKLGELLGGAAETAATAISKRLLPGEIEKAAAEEAASAETLYEQELNAELALRQAQKAYDAGEAADKPALRVALELAKRKLAWQTRLREAAGLPARDPVDPS